MDRVRIGVLGAARITPMAMIRPARQVPEAVVQAVAARDPERARKFGAKHGIPTTHASYDELLADPGIDAVYNPLPNSLHCEWTLKALEAGKHVLCEKPFAANTAEAEQMATAAERTGKVLMEAFHYRYHPLAARVLEIVDGGEIGRLEHVETWMCVPLLLPGDIRYRLDLAGGAMMDVGSYTTHMLRTFGREEPEVTRAVARLSSPEVDRWMQAEFRFPSGYTGRTTCSMFSSTLLRIAVHLRGDRGEVRVFNPVVPQLYHRLSLRTERGKTVERVSRDATYMFQLRAFAAAVLRGTPTLTPPSDAVANMRVIDAVYRSAGMRPRG